MLQNVIGSNLLVFQPVLFSQHHQLEKTKIYSWIKIFFRFYNPRWVDYHASNFFSTFKFQYFHSSPQIWSMALEGNRSVSVIKNKSIHLQQTNSVVYYMNFVVLFEWKIGTWFRSSFEEFHAIWSRGETMPGIRICKSILVHISACLSNQIYVRIYNLYYSHTHHFH